jgi:hypothetical protein
VVEADINRLSQLTEQFSEQKNWSFSNALISDKCETLPYFKASYHVESGLLNPEKLNKVWPNIKVQDKNQREATTLHELVHKLKLIVPNWLIIDCLPALTILEGALETLQDYDVIVVRTLNAEIEKNINDKAGARPIEAFLASKGYRCLATQIENNLNIGHSLFIKDKIKELKTEITKQAKNIKALGEKAANSTAKYEKTNQVAITLKQEVEQSERNTNTNKIKLEKTKQKLALKVLDMKDLEKQYAQLKEDNNELTKLLKKVTKNLLRASTSLSGLEKIEKILIDSIKTDK